MRKNRPVVPVMVSSLTAFTAMATCVIVGIDPWTSVLRGIVAGLVGYFAGSLWEAVFGTAEVEVVQLPGKNEARTDQDDRLEEGSALPEEAA